MDRGPTGVSIVVPVHNSADTIEPLVKRVSAALSGHQLEIILVDDASKDASWEAISAQQAGDDRVRGIRLMRNYGQHNALLAGIRAARQDRIVTIDDDLEQPPEAIPRLLDALAREGADVAYGSRAGSRPGFLRERATRIFRGLLRRGFGVTLAKSIAPLRAFRSELKPVFAGNQGPYVSIDALLSWGTTRFAIVDVEYAPRGSGKSGYPLHRRLRHAILEVTGFSTLPLRLASLLGLVTTLFGAGVLAYVIGKYAIEGGGVPGFPFLASIISIFAGAQLLALGVIGEYLARVHERSMDRPPYVIREPEDG